jgi:hypothetical protein
MAISLAYPSVEEAIFYSVKLFLPAFMAFRERRWEMGQHPVKTPQPTRAKYLPVVPFILSPEIIHLSVCLPRSEKRRRRGADVGGVRRSASPELPPAPGRGEHGAAGPRIFAAQHSLVRARTPFSRGLASEKTERAIIPRFVKRRALGLILTSFLGLHHEKQLEILYCIV